MRDFWAEGSRQRVCLLVAKLPANDGEYTVSCSASAYGSPLRSVHTICVVDGHCSVPVSHHDVTNSWLLSRA